MAVFYAEIINKLKKNEKKFLVNRVYIIAKNVDEVRKELLKEFNEDKIKAIYIDKTPTQNKIISLISLKKTRSEINDFLKLVEHEKFN